MAEEQSKGFKVTDRRIFSADTAAEKAPDAAARPAAPPTPDPATARPLPPVDFQTFVISIGSSALLCLGVVENPETGRRETDLILAKHNIDLLAMLEQKTRNNLSADEARLLSSLLYDLRLKYVEAARSAKAP